MMTTFTTPPRTYVLDPKEEQHRARLRDLVDTQNDLVEAIEGLAWQRDLRKKDLRKARHDFEEIARQRTECLVGMTCDESVNGRLRRNQVLADASLAQLQVSTIQKQVEYLERRIAEMRQRLEEIREEITKRTMQPLSSSGNVHSPGLHGG
jgi:hypothetical protein